MSTAETRTRAEAPRLDDAFDLELEQMALAHSEPPLEAPDKQSGLPRYLRWQLRDYLKYRAAFMLPLAMLALWIFRYNYSPAHLPPGISPEKEAEFFRNIMMGASVVLGALGSLFSTAGIVAREREGGYQRFLFAKPLRVTSYYLQSFVVNGLGLLALSAVVLAITSIVFVRPVPFTSALLAIASTYVAVGGLSFLMSTLVRFDFAFAAFLSVLSFPLHQAAMRGKWWAIATSWLLPPVYKLDAFASSGAGHSIGDAVGSMLTYGAAYIAGAIAVLKRRSIIR